MKRAPTAQPQPGCALSPCAALSWTRPRLAGHAGAATRRPRTAKDAGCYLGGECRLAVPLKCHGACQWSWRIRVRHTPSRANWCPVTSIRRPTGSVNYQRQWRLWRVRVMKCQTRYQCQCHGSRPHTGSPSLAGWPGGGTGKPGLRRHSRRPARPRFKFGPFHGHGPTPGSDPSAWLAKFKLLKLQPQEPPR